MVQSRLLTLALVSCLVDSFSIVQQWLASPKGGSILTCDFVALEKDEGPSRSLFLFTAGHSDQGQIRMWPLYSITSTDDQAYHHEAGTTNSTAVGCEWDNGISVHQGSSIFSIASLDVHQKYPGSAVTDYYLVSGSFDRSASLHRIVPNNSNNNEHEQPPLPDVTTNIATLPEHTGWVRQVHAISHATTTSPSGSRLFVLSIGCNLINVWTTTTATATTATINGGDKEGGVVRLARLDAGPSPNDPLDESEFRRHDILTMAPLLPAGDEPWIVAGLVDGSLRVFCSRWEAWYERLEWEHPPYDATGSCAFDSAVIAAAEEVTDDQQRPVVMVQDEEPIVSTNAHTGRVSAIVPVPPSSSSSLGNEFVSVGYDGRWMHWKINANTETLEKVQEGCIPTYQDGTDERHIRISTACILLDEDDDDDDNEDTNHKLLLGTVGGSLFMGDLARGGACDLVWKGDNGISITSMSTYLSADSRPSLQETLVAVGCSNGTVMLCKF